VSAIKPTCWEEAAAHGEVTMQLPPGHERTIERTNPKLLRTLTRPFPARAAQLLPVTVSRAAVLKQRPRKKQALGIWDFRICCFLLLNRAGAALISVAIRKSVRPWLPLGNAEGVPPIAAQWQGTGGGEAVGRASGQGAKCAAARCDLMMSVPLDGLVTARAFSLLELSIAKLQFNSHRSRNRSQCN
jgi:hypothetical protein